VPRLLRTARTKTDARGCYRFNDVPAGTKYQIVGVSVEEDGTIIVVGMTPKLKAGEKLRLDLSENDPWTAPSTGDD